MEQLFIIFDSKIYRFWSF